MKGLTSIERRMLADAYDVASSAEEHAIFDGLVARGLLRPGPCRVHQHEECSCAWADTTSDGFLALRLDEAARSVIINVGENA